MEDDFYALLASHVPLTTLVPASKITPSVYSQSATGTLVRYQMIDGTPGLHMQGSDGLTSSLMQVDIRAASVAAAKAVRAVLIGKHGTGGLLHPYRGIVGLTAFQVISLRSDRGIRHEKPGTQDFYTASLDFDIWSRAA